MTSKYLRGNRLSLNNDRNEELNLGSLAMRDDRILLRSILWEASKTKGGGQKKKKVVILLQPM